MEYYKLLNDFNTNKLFTDGTLKNTTQLVKNITIPLNMEFKNNGYSDLINELAKKEKDSNINSVLDKENIKFNSAYYDTSDRSILDVNFNFIDDSGSGGSFIYAGFEQSDIDESKNRLVKSFFKLDFFDSPDENTQNYLFSEYFNVNLSTTPQFKLNRLFWLKRDTKFINDNTHRLLYFSVNFFNAKDGTVRQFINREVTSPITIGQYKNNPSWRFAEIKILNPLTDVVDTSSNPNRVFYVEPINGNTDTSITFTEVKIT